MKYSIWLLVATELFLAINARNDLYKKQILPVSIPIYLAGAAALLFAGDGFYWKYSLAGLIPGMVLAIFSFISGGAVGYGDAMIVLCIGGIFGPVNSAMTVMYALFLSVPVSAFLLMTRRVKKTDTIPFVPFLLAAYMGGFWFG